MEKIVKEIGDILSMNGLTIGTAESCTSGLISAALASQDGASRYFRGGIVSYATDLKTSLLDVGVNTIRDNDVVSAQVAQQMALGAIYKLKVDVSVAITGYAGATGGSEKSPRGTIWICVGSNIDGSISFDYKMLIVNGKRGENINIAIEAALELVLKHLKEKL